MKPSRPKIVIIGAGFGGLRAARDLAGAQADVVLLDRHNYHLFQPLLYQVATAGLEPEQIAKPVRAILRGQQNLDFRMVEVTSIDLSAKVVVTAAGPIGYDFLIVAVGGETSFFGLEGVARHGFGLKDVDDAVSLRNQVLGCFEKAMLEADPERRKALLSLVVAGGGPTGVEMAGALSELVHLVLVKDYPRLDVSEVRILLLEAKDRLLVEMPEELSAAATRTLEAKRVEVRFGAAVEDYDGRNIRLRGGEQLASRTLVWAAGAQAASLVRDMGLEHSRQGRVPVTPTLQLPSHPEVYVIGDAAYLENKGQPLPMMAPVALQMADSVVENILRQLRGLEPKSFEYRDPGSLATIGRNAAVARIGGLKFKGFLAWVVWLVVHLVQLIGFRNRLFVLVNWAVDYFFYDRAVRLIVPNCRSQGRPRHLDG